MFDRAQGLIYRNVIPVCGACDVHFINGFDKAKEEARIYLGGQTLPKVIPQKDEGYGHAEYQQ
ncbi:MAG TPA: hypothetical protein VHV10_02740 [Ktedonobacteraceae bacterium]|nr:hypothetical protein [Ktedonobacteraceae bacterium]